MHLAGRKGKTAERETIRRRVEFLFASQVRLEIGSWEVDTDRDREVVIRAVEQSYRFYLYCGEEEEEWEII